MASELETALRSRQTAFGICLSDDQIAALDAYYCLLSEHNPLLHLVAACPPEEFASRHILESLTLLPHLPQNFNIADVGSGGGLPSLPCVLVRKDLRAALIESKEKKAAFLQRAVDELGLTDRVTVINRQFSETTAEGFGAVTCRALDKFTEKLPALVKWAKGRRMLLFGGKTLAEALTKQGMPFESRLMPLSDRRFLFIMQRRPRKDAAHRISSPYSRRRR